MHCLSLIKLWLSLIFFFWPFWIYIFGGVSLHKMPKVDFALRSSLNAYVLLKLLRTFKILLKLFIDVVNMFSLIPLRYFAIHKFLRSTKFLGPVIGLSLCVNKCSCECSNNMICILFALVIIFLKENFIFSFLGNY